MKNKIIFWSTTGILSLMMLFSALAYFTNPEVKAGFETMGYPDYFRVELGIAKILGTIVLLLPLAPKLMKEWAYAGFAITFVSAFITHIVNGDPASAVMMPLVMLGILIVSRLYFAKLKAE